MNSLDKNKNSLHMRHAHVLGNDTRNWRNHVVIKTNQRATAGMGTTTVIIGTEYLGFCSVSLPNDICQSTYLVLDCPQNVVGKFVCFFANFQLRESHPDIFASLLGEFGDKD